MLPHNAYSVGRITGKKPGWLCQLLPVQACLWACQPPGTTKKTPRTEEGMRKGKRKHVNDFEGNYYQMYVHSRKIKEYVYIIEYRN